MNQRSNPVQLGIDRVALLADPTRRALYEYAVAAPDRVDRDSAAAAVGIGRPLAAFHLDRLAEGGLLLVEYHRRTGRSGPGAGRPAKFYRPTPGDSIEVSVPPRRYLAPARIFAEAIEAAGLADIRQFVTSAARTLGAAVAQEANGGGATTRTNGQALWRVLSELGFEPEIGSADGIRLRNCPFRVLSDRHRELMCGANFAMLESVAEALPPTGLEARRRVPGPLCCVEFASSQAAAV
jgi:predicted ArsR family transcriptional regulator